ncbi:alpha/beta fold hydrolase [Streptomyces sp. NPDC056641]|uniref:alpha/beta fold hydrolase n=1 Tax=unclassified Streptomyces TaxID=2593676 RepID=UPI0036910C36
MARLPRLLRAAVSPPRVSRSSAVTTMERLSATTHLVSSLEYLVTEKDRLPGGMNDWRVGREQFRAWPAPVRKVLDVVSGPRGGRVLHGARVVAAAALLAPLPRRGRLAADLVLSATSLALYPRNHYGTDGSDQVAFLVQTTATVARALEDRPRAVDACLWFAGLQSVLSYATSGWVKVSSPTWRSGRALPGVMRTKSYGEATTWRLLTKYPRTSHALSTGVLALECAFPVVHLAKGRAAPALVAAVGGFHLANAGVMGLGRFLTSFCSLHPAVLYIAGPRVRTWPDGRVERRDDAFPVAVGALLAAALAAGVVSRTRQRRIVLRGRGDEREMTTASGNTLSYRWTGDPAEALDPAAPVVVLEHALSATPERAEWLVSELSARHPVVTYQRAGYGRSGYAGSRHFDIDSGADDLADLVAHVAGDRPVVLIGHSLGGYLVARAARRLPGQVVGLGLIDPSHPGEMSENTGTQDPDGQRVTDVLNQMAISLRLCLGPLLKSPDWLGQLPSGVRELAEAQYRDPAVWSAALREWRGSLARFRLYEGPLPAADVPVCLVTCARTNELTEAQKDLQDEYAQVAPRSVRHVLDVHRDAVVGERASATRVAGLMTEFIGGLGDDAADREEGAADVRSRL